MRKIIWLTTLFIIFAACSKKAPALLDISSVNQVEQVDFSHENNVLIDVRTPEEFSEGHIPNAININVSDENFENEIKKLDPDKNYYVYCRSGKRSTDAAEKMEKEGLNKVVNLKDGYKNYQQ